jgi:hypothetical protein
MFKTIVVILEHDGHNLPRIDVKHGNVIINGQQIGPKSSKPQLKKKKRAKHSDFSKLIELNKEYQQSFKKGLEELKELEKFENNRREIIKQEKKEKPDNENNIITVNCKEKVLWNKSSESIGKFVDVTEEELEAMFN